MNKKSVLNILLIIVFTVNSLFVQIYKLDCRIKHLEIKSSHLKMGGTDQLGESIDVNSYYISINKKPAIPVTGEFHFFHYPSQYREETIRKMKVGGIDIIATYVFWNIHEEIGGQFNCAGKSSKSANPNLFLNINPYIYKITQTST